MRLLTRLLYFPVECLLVVLCYGAIWCGERFFGWRSPE